MKRLLMLTVTVITVVTLHAAEPIDGFDGKPLDVWTTSVP